MCVCWFVQSPLNNDWTASLGQDKVSSASLCRVFIARVIAQMAMSSSAEMMRALVRQKDGVQHSQASPHLMMCRRAVKSEAAYQINGSRHRYREHTSIHCKHAQRHC